MKVFLCESIHAQALALLQTRAEILSDFGQIGDCEAIINRNLQLTPAVLAQAGRLKVVAIHGTGTDGVDLPYCRSRGITVFNVPYQNADSVAELIVALTQMLLRKLHLADRLVTSGAPIQNAPPELFGHELAGKTIGLVGTGDIARRAGRIFREGFRAKVIGYSPSLTPEKAAGWGIGYCACLSEVLERSDVVSIGVRLNDQTRGLIDAAALHRMKPTAVLINTARGGVVDEAALYQALSCGTIAGAACDVFLREPPTPDNPLVGLPNFIATPHLGANTDEALRRVGMTLVEELFRVMDGAAPASPCI